MDQRRLAALVRWDNIGLGQFELHVPMFDRPVDFVLFPADGAESVVTEGMARTVEDVLRLEPAALATIESLLWEECLFSFQVADYGVDIEPGETSLQAHLREFGVACPQDAWRKARLNEIQISDGHAARFAQIKFDTVANNLIGIIVKDGRIVDYDDDGTYLGWFEGDERRAHKRRQNILK
ncbi:MULTISPECIES: hypothetical protein [unclassified Lysobacter]|uniref:hypothetical protein n=1 Tax=unclassified Lysobacter TaxID=2635362 RepID=UPI001BEBEB84|nr:MULTISPECIES: hypothetical protein [unclassified Lysobacter]MBT2749225.1 hypothetical protein [Lysobacter sp. ISL-42]MBT2754065.1 hypothetical protein [Lysobacter sp. ISL-50]MBT2779436.1 hypothetical protein [Lysobacter sp. ISL-54]MBT2781691.1 hypothetical protein [Lysobacter sp. ISL-52]